MVPARGTAPWVGRMGDRRPARKLCRVGARAAARRACRRLPLQTARAPAPRCPGAPVILLGCGRGRKTGGARHRVRGGPFLFAPAAGKEALGLGVVICRTMSPKYVDVLTPVLLNEAAFGDTVTIEVIKSK